ncbi:MAG: ATP-binding cassette domain-containing protein [Alphaproteobacteria bacterium]
MEPFVIIDSITKKFNASQTSAIDNISAEIFSGRITGLVGPDGAGKTTLIRLIIGLLTSDNGEILVKGLNAVSDTSKIHNISGYMPQKFGLYEDLTVIENLNLYADLRNLPLNLREAKFSKLLKFTELTSFQKRLAGKLSGGMKQKLGLACALIGEPELLLLDEPSVGVDPISRRELWKMVKELVSDGMAVIWSTAYLDEAEKCDSVLLLNDGKKLYDGSPENLLNRVDNRVWQITDVENSKKRPYLLDILKDDEVIDGIIQGKSLRVVTKEVQTKSQFKNNNWRTAKPKFEDAFIDILGGCLIKKSYLAEEMPSKPKDNLIAINANQLTKKFGDFTAVKNNSFEIKRGEIFGLLGPNGAGKSTTFKMLCGLLQPTSGKALVAGLDLKTSTSKARSKIGYMAQKFSLYGHLNVRQNLQFFSGLYGLSKSRQKHQIDLMISLFALEKHLTSSANDLPLGFKQRLALACAVMHQPDVLFLDEPTSGVDPLTRREFWLHINAMVEKGVTVMVTTHFMDEAEYCDRIGLIYQGKNIATGSPDELKNMAKFKNDDDLTLEDAFIRLVNQNNPKDWEKNL